MRTIKKIFADRLEAQASEAQLQGHIKVASQLKRIVNSVPKRDSDDAYVYASDDFETNVESHVWDIIVRAADFYDSNFDALELQPVVQKLATEIVKEARTHFGNRDGVGAYEPIVPGESIKKRASIEVDDDE